MTDEISWSLPTLIHFGWIISSSNANKPVTTCFSAMTYGVLFLFAAWLISLFFVCKQPTMIFKFKGDHTPFVLDFMKDGEYLWNTICEHDINKTTCENAFAEAEFYGTHRSGCKL
jgi:hypothetical protein